MQHFDQRPHRGSTDPYLIVSFREVIMSCVVQWRDVLVVKGMHFSSKNARLLNLTYIFITF